MLGEEKILKVSDGEYHYSSGYYTMNKWIDNDNIVIARSKDQTIGVRENPMDDTIELVKVSLKDNKITVLCDDALNFAEHVVHGSKVYYSTGTELKFIDINSGESGVIYKNEYYSEGSTGGLYKSEMAQLHSPHITNDGKTVSMFIGNENQPTIFIAVDTETGNARKLFEKKFEGPFFWANHGMICPENPDLLFFCHEGITFYVSNRLWLYDAKTGKAWNIAKQRLDDDGNLGDCYGHEMWAPDGRGLYFVKYKCSPTPPRGICYVDAQTGKAELLYSAYGYWHVGVSCDGRYLTSDTQTGKDYSEVVLIDRENNTETVIDHAKTNWTHPCHPHPQLSPDNSKLMYTALDENGRTCTKIALLK